MDPSSISPAPPTNTVPYAVEPNNNHSPPPPTSTHPPYAEMIYTAIEALKEKNGSSKIAIAKYIEQVYKDQLPPSHSNLLTHHLKRLKSEGLLQMVRKSYIIPRSGQPIPVPSSPTPTSASPSKSSRPRGRPRKTQPQAQTQPLPVAIVPVPAVVNNNSVQQQQNAEPVWAALGLTDEPQPAGLNEETKRRRGRPKKGTGPSPSVNPVQAGTGTPSRRGSPPGSKAKKRTPGRPPKIQQVNLNAAAAAVPVAKKRPGRPPKNQQQNPTVIPFATAAVPEVEVAAVLTPRSRGRPRKNAVPVAAVPVAVVAAAAGRGRGRGRGRGAGAGAGGGRGRGRGRGGGAGITVEAKPTGKRPVGRPKKGTTPATATASAPQNAVNEELKKKLEYFQGKVKESLAVLRPHFNHESPVTAIAAIQDLEILGTMDLNAPLRDEMLPPQPNMSAQDQQPPQQQVIPQQHLPPQQVLAPSQVFPQYPPFQLQDYPSYQQQQQQQPIYQAPPQQQQPIYQAPPQQNQFHP